MKALLVSSDPSIREHMAVAVASLERRTGSPLEFVEASNGEIGVRVTWRERPDLVIADEMASRAGAFSLARDLRGAEQPYRGIIVILLDRPHDAWLANWAGADAWFVKPFDPFELTDTVLELLTQKKEIA
jgi:DNA-binding response OmpR family regulator